MEQLNLFDNIEEIKNNTFNKIYSNQFLISNFFETYNISDIFDEKIYNFLKIQITKLENYNILKSGIFYYKIFMFSKKKIYINIILNNYIQQNIISKIENFYNLEKYSLNINKLFIINTTNVDKEKRDFQKHIEFDKNKNKTEFIFVISMDDISNMVKFNLMPDNIYSIKKNCGFVFCNRLDQYIINNENKILLICFISYYDGYDKFEYNGHPNLKHC